MSKWFENFPKLSLGLSPEYVAQTRQYVGRSYSAAFLFSLVGIGIGVSLKYFSDDTPKDTKVETNIPKK